MALEGQFEIRTVITRSPLQTLAVDKPEVKGIELSFFVLVGGEAVQHTYTVGEEGRKVIKDALFPGLVIPDTIPPEELI